MGPELMGYSQNGEDVLVAQWLPEVGTLLDIGANDGEHYSNSRRFMENGWVGVFVEPDPTNLHQLRALYSGTTANAYIIAAAVVPNRYLDDIVDIYPSERYPGVGGCLDLWPTHRKKWGNSAQFGAPVSTRAIRADDLCPAQAFDLVSLDIEGGNVDVARDLEWERLCKGVAIIEHDGHISDITAAVGPAFTQVAANAENVIYLRRT